MTEYDKQNPSSIQSLFDSIALRYDRGNSLMSFHLHALWNYYFVKLLFENREVKEALDLCAGTGEIAIRSCDFLPIPPQFTLVDFSKNMLDLAKIRLAKYPHFSFIQADATHLPLTSEQYEVATMAYGIRNIHEKLACFEEVHRVLKTHGRFGILELTQPSNTILRMLHKVYLQTYVPFVGRFFISNKKAYEYLCNSIQAFPEPENIVSTLTQARFSSVKTIPLFGGIATIFLATKEP